MKNKYVCKNCNKGQNKKYVDAMRKAGFGLQHLKCKNCGQQTVTENK